MQLSDYLVALICAFSFASDLSGLDWDAKSRTVELSPFNGAGYVKFIGKNKSDLDIEIVKVEGGCSCVEISTSEKAVSPGEEFCVLAKFSMTGKVGEFERIVKVHYPDASFDELKVNLQARRAVRLSSEFVKIGDEGQEILEIQHISMDFKLTKIKLRKSLFSYEVLQSELSNRGPIKVELRREFSRVDQVVDLLYVSLLHEASGRELELSVPVVSLP